MNISNRYVICDTPADSDSVWSYVVDRSHVRRSLDGSQVVLKWPVSTSPHWAMVSRLGGTTYIHSDVLAVLAGPDWTAPLPE
jgi:hypothetical protein